MKPSGPNLISLFALIVITFEYRLLNGSQRNETIVWCATTKALIIRVCLVGLSVNHHIDRRKRKTSGFQNKKV